MSSDPTKIKAVKEVGSSDIFFSLVRLPESERVFVGSSDFKVHELDLSEEKPEPVAAEGEGHQSYVTGLALAGRFVVSGSYDGRLIWWDIETRQPVRPVEAHGLWIRRVTASPDGRVIASVADDMQCKLWDAETGEPLRTLSDHQPITPNNYPSMLYAVAYSRDGRWLATGDKVGHVAIWDAVSGEKVGEVEAPEMYTWDPRARIHSIGGIRSLEFSPDGERLAVGGIGKIGNIDHLGGPARIEIFDWRKGERLLEISDDKHKGLVEKMAFAPEGEWLLAVGGDHKGFISFFDPKGGQVIHQDAAHQHIHDMALNETADRLYTAHHGRIVVWQWSGE